ncbi:4Fe-4S binding protein [Arcobacter sp. KX21116]|jgi:pyruvate ferredoxin oxidoreductase delta subunit|uniref:4Fe-4S binding protein n=1 Tax=Arcobacter TaxID=28196 RepID=UPI0035D511DE|tara:strand:+ start:2638 stop:3051 length:414 start_codon:yes stop_codon:yes gene_type:complete
MSKSIKDMGWDELVPGAALFSFDQAVESVLAQTNPEDRTYAETSSKNLYVGDWRVMKPVWNTELCIDCQNCWIYCPDSAVISRNKEIQGIDYTHCKGCGICVEVCPTNPKSLMMFNETEKNELALTKWPLKKEKGEK